MFLNEKVDYSKDPEAPISLGMKLLKKLEKEGWKGADIYDEIYEIIVMSDVKYPKQMAMRLKRTLENYDMWEAPYKGLVTKIQKWQFVNENFAAVAGPIAKAAGRYAAMKFAGRAADSLGDKFDNMLNGSTNESESDIDDYDRAYAAIDKLIYKYKEWTFNDVRNQLDNGDIWFQDIMNEMGIDVNNLSDEKDEELCEIIINAMQNYLDDKDYFAQLHESISEDFYYRPMDIKQLMNKNKERGTQLSRFEHWVLDAALWARARMKNYHGYSDKIPAVEYKNGKFYAQTQDGMVEVPYNYNDMTPEWLFRK